MRLRAPTVQAFALVGHHRAVGAIRRVQRVVGRNSRAQRELEGKNGFALEVLKELSRSVFQLGWWVDKTRKVNAS